MHQENMKYRGEEKNMEKNNEDRQKKNFKKKGKGNKNPKKDKKNGTFSPFTETFSIYILILLFQLPRINTDSKSDR